MIRFSSLGDIVLAGAVTGQLGEVSFRTLPRYADLARRLPGVARVLGPDDAPVGGRVIDLHNNLRSRQYRADMRVARQDWRRRARVWFKGPPADAVVTRYARAAGVVPGPPPWLPPVGRGARLVLAPGAAHATKRWPYWRELARLWDGPVTAIGGPGEEAIVAELGGVAEAGFERTLEAMQGGAVLVAGDTGLLHLGAAVGLPVVGIFGPTTSTDGFFHYTTGAVAVELPLSCRPCSRFGGTSCPVGDHACLRGLSAERVLAAARSLA
ncbi:MAG: glycosyltransferase family 9 protein [Deltaproteobacteria bacterium]|nr:glycosyltransferase family 9 protein [Deltaproteobacteria bacterium]